MKILLINNQFAIGGAARVAATMCDQFLKMNIDLHIITDNLNWPYDYKFRDGAVFHTIDLNPNLKSKKNKIKKAIQCIKNIRRFIKQVSPDVIIAIQADMYIRTLIAKSGINIPLIVADHNSFSTYAHDSITNFIRKHLYGLADGLTILTKKDAKILGSKYLHKKVIYNPLSFPPLQHNNHERQKNILCVGRLDAWQIKGFDTILSIWADLQSNYPEWKLQIAGSGNESSMQYMEQLIALNNLNGRVDLLGQVTDMQSLYQSSSIFALPSRVEGFPMSLLEAMSQGCACVAFEVNRSSNEMMGDDSGILVADNDTNSLKNALEGLIKSPQIRKNLSNNAISRSKLFSPIRFGKEWIEYINQTITHK